MPHDQPPAEAAPDVWRVTTPLPSRPRAVHAYLVRAHSGSWLLVDGGANTDAAWTVLDDAVRRVAGGWGAVRHHLITHMHVDHLGLAARVRDACHARVAMGVLDAERVAHADAHPEEEAAYRAELLRANGAPADLAAGGAAGPSPLASPVVVDWPLPLATEPLAELQGWLSVWTPGHTAGHVGLFRPADGLLLAGDALLASVTPTIGVNRQRPDPVADYLGTLDRLEALRPAVALAGHGAPVHDVAGRILELRRETRAETARVRALLQDRPLTAWQVARARYPERDLPPSAWMQALRETRAHLDHLVLGGRARAAADDVVRFWLV